MVLSDIALDIGLIVKAELDLKMSRMEVITSNIIVNICMWLWWISEDIQLATKII